MQAVERRVLRWTNVVTEVVRKAYRSWLAHRTIRFGAALAYYWLFALIPLALVAVALVRLLLPDDLMAPAVTEAVQGLRDSDSEVVREVLQALEARLASGTTTLVAVIVAFVAASFAFVATQDSLQQVWNIPRGHGLQVSLRRRLVSFLAVLIVGSAVVILMLTAAVLAVLTSILPLEIPDVLSSAASALIPLLLVAASVAALYKYFPATRISWRSVLTGSAITAVGLLLGGYLFGLYLSRWSTPSFEGAAASIALLLAWMYYTAQIFLGGAELTRAIEVQRRNGPGSKPKS